MAGLLIRVVSLGFALVEAALLIRLLLPFVDTVPKAFRPLVVQLIVVTDVLIAPFRSVVSEPFRLGQVLDLPGEVVGLMQAYVDRVDPAVVVAMIAWGLIGGLVVVGLRLLFR